MHTNLETTYIHPDRIEAPKRRKIQPHHIGLAAGVLVIMGMLIIGVNYLVEDIRSQELPGIARECSRPQTGWLWCDDFEDDRLDKYFEFLGTEGSFIRDSGMGIFNSKGMRAEALAGG